MDNINLTTSRLIGFLALVLSFAFCTSIAKAQWSSNGNNIYNTNSGFVGIGSSSTPGSPLTVFAPSGVVAITRDQAW